MAKALLAHRLRGHRLLFPARLPAAAHHVQRAASLLWPLSLALNLT
jgi:hypothetical protein